MLTFDAEAHRYFWNGQPVPGVTGLLDSLIDFSHANESALQRARELGTAVHLACELYDKDDLDEAELDPVLRPYLDGWVKFRHETGFVPAMLEQRVYHEQLKYAGTLDRYGLLNDQSAVLDIKSGALYPAVGPQLSAYEQALISGKDWTGPRKLKRYAVQLKPDGTYKLHPCTNATDWACFVGLLNVNRWKKNHNLKYEGV